MNADDAVILATSRVWERYPVVPPVAMVYEFSDRVLAALKAEANGLISEGEWQEESRKFRGKWFVAFYCSSDTDALGLPESLCLLVDDFGGEVMMV